MLGRTLVLAASASMAAASFGRLGHLDTFDVPSSLPQPKATVFPFTPASVDLVGTGNWVLNPHIDSTHTFAFQTSQVQVNAAFRRAACTAGRPVKSICTDSPGYVGLSYDRCTGRFITVTDNGPTQACSNDAEATGFALGDYTPVLGQFYIDRNEARMSPFTPLKASNGSYLTGLPNKPTDGKIFEGLKANGECQNFGLNNYRPSGLDLADVQFLNEGLFIGSDEYGPKLVVFNTDGTVLVSYVPKGLETTTYKEDVNGGPTNGILPAIFAGRSKNRGISALAVDPKKERLVACLESAADGAGVEGATASAELRTSRVVRCVQLNITNVLEPVLINEFVVLQSDAAVEYTAAKRGHASLQSQVSFVGGTWSEDRCTFLLLEQGRVDSQLPSLVGIAVDVCGGSANETLHADYTATALNADNIPTGLAALEGKTTQGDAETNLRLLPQKVFATKQWKAFDLRDSFATNPGKISGVTLISPYAIAVIEDTDFGYRASATAFEPTYAKVSVVHFPKEVWRTQGREAATADWCETSVGPKHAIPQVATARAGVTTYVMPPMVLSGAVNPAGDWWGATQTGTHNNRQCSAVAFTASQSEQVCNDAPAFTGLMYDRCKNTFRALTDAGPTQDCSAGVQAHTYQDFSPSFVQFDLHAAQLGTTNSWKVVRPTKFTSLRVFYDLFAATTNIGGTAAGNRVQSASSYMVGGVSPAAPFSKSGKVGAACGADIRKTYANFAQGATATGGAARDVSPTGMHKVREGLYATCDGYTSSVVFFDESGRIVRRYTAGPVASNVYGEPTHPVLPAIFAGTRQLGKCVLAVKADGSRLVVLLDQPLTGARLGNENAQVARRSNVVRAVMVNIRDLAHPFLENEKVVEQSNAEVTYTAAVTGYVNTQEDVRFTAATWLNRETVFVLETARSNHSDSKIAARLFSVDFGTGTDIKDVDAFNSRTITTDGVQGIALVEYQGRFPNTTADHLARLSPEVKAMNKTQVIDFQDIVAGGAVNATNAKDGITSSRLAGLAIVSPALLAVFEPSTYGYGQEARQKAYSKVHLITLAEAIAIEETDDCYPHPATDAPTAGASSAAASLTVLLVTLVALML